MPVLIISSLEGNVVCANGMAVSDVASVKGMTLSLVRTVKSVPGLSAARVILSALSFAISRTR